MNHSKVKEKNQLNTISAKQNPVKVKEKQVGKYNNLKRDEGNPFECI